MDKIEQKHLQHINEIQAVEYTMKWYGWGSPIGLSIFFLTLTIIGVVIYLLVTGVIK